MTFVYNNIDIVHPKCWKWNCKYNGGGIEDRCYSFEWIFPSENCWVVRQNWIKGAQNEVFAVTILCVIGYWILFCDTETWDAISSMVGTQTLIAIIWYRYWTPEIPLQKYKYWSQPNKIRQHARTAHTRTRAHKRSYHNFKLRIRKQGALFIHYVFRGQEASAR